MALLAATSPTVATAFIEIGAVAVGLALLARLAGRFGISTIPLYLLAGLAVGEGGVAPLDVSEGFISLVAEIGVLLLLLALGLEYRADQLRDGLRSGLASGALDAALNFTPGFAAGLLLGLSPTAAVLLGGVCWVTSSGIVAKVLTEQGWMCNRETGSVLSLLVLEDLAMAVFLPVVAALVTGKAFGDTVVTVAIAVAAVVIILAGAVRLGAGLSRLLAAGSDEALLLAVFGLTLLVGGLAQRLEVSAAIGAFVVGLALSGPVQARAAALIEPLRDLFAAVFFLFFSFRIEPRDVLGALAPAAALAVVALAGKGITGWVVARGPDATRQSRLRAGAALMARGEFSIVVANLGDSLQDGPRLGAIAATFVLLTAIAGPLAARWVDRRPANG